jgi:hypothetical protein
MRPAIEAGLMVLLEAADPYMRPVLHRQTVPQRLYAIVRKQDVPLLP